VVKAGGSRRLCITGRASAVSCRAPPPARPGSGGTHPRVGVALSRHPTHTPQMASAPPPPPPPRGRRLSPAPPAFPPLARDLDPPRKQSTRTEVLKEASLLSTLMSEMMRRHAGQAATPIVNDSQMATLAWANPPGKRTRRLARHSQHGAPLDAASTRDDEALSPAVPAAPGVGGPTSSPPVAAVSHGAPAAVAAPDVAAKSVAKPVAPVVPDATGAVAPTQVVPTSTLPTAPVAGASVADRRPTPAQRDAGPTHLFPHGVGLQRPPEPTAAAGKRTGGGDTPDAGVADPFDARPASP